MANAILSRNRRAYVTKVTAFGTAVTPTNSNAFRYINLAFAPQQSESIRPDLNPSLDIALGTLGRKSCTFTGSASLAAAAAAGSAPDLGPIFESWLGGETLAAGTSATYACADTPKYIDLWQYVTPSTGDHEAGLSCQVKNLSIAFGGDYATVDFSGLVKSYVTAGSLTSLDTEGKCGLSAFPTEPASPVVNGAAVSGYRGTITIDGNVYTIAKSGKLTGDNGAEYQQDGWGTDYPQAGAPGQRQFSLDISLYDDDSTAFNSLKTKAVLGTPVDATFVLGSGAGSTYTFTLKNIIMAKPQYENSGVKRIVNFSNCLCHVTNGTSRDAFKIVLT